MTGEYLTKLVAEPMSEGCELHFSQGTIIKTLHHSYCCETHFMCLDDIKTSDFEGLYFSLWEDGNIIPVKDYGFELKPNNGHPVRIPCYGFNNGYYSHELQLVLTKKDREKYIDLTECQSLNDGGH